MLTRPGEPISLNIYRKKILVELFSFGINIKAISDHKQIPAKYDGYDVLWEPGLCMRRLPGMLKQCRIPIIGTMHGVKAFSLPVNELTRDLDEQAEIIRLKHQLSMEWAWFKKKVSAVVAVSNYAAIEVANAFDIPRDKIYTIHNGIDHNIFNLDSSTHTHPKPYFLHVSHYNSLKNTERLFNAYASLPLSNRPDLMAVLPGYQKRHDILGLTIIRETLSQTKLATYYKGALCFILPSLRETFGMPIIEAMACGRPVTTSNITGCLEVAGDAACLVDPRSTREIMGALKRFMEDEKTRQACIAKGLSRASRFSWKKCAADLITVFDQIAQARDQTGCQNRFKLKEFKHAEIIPHYGIGSS